MGNTTQALYFQLEAVELIPELPNRNVFAIDAYFNLAEAQAKSGLIDDAERSYRLSLEAATKVGNIVSEVEGRVRLGSILADRGHETEALSTIEEALRLSRSSCFPLQEVSSLLACGRIELKLGHMEAATDRFQAAVEVADSHKMGDLLPTALESLAAVKAATHHYDEAYRALLRSVEAAHTWSNSESIRKLAELATGYRLEKAKRDAEVERSRREGLESANERLRMVTRIGRSLTQCLEPKDILMRMWAELSTSIDLMCLAFGIYSPDSGIIEFPGMIDTGVVQRASSVFLSDESSLAAHCVREKRVLYFATRDEARAALGGNALISLGSRAVTAETILFLPLFRENDIVGVMTAQSAKDHAYSNDIIEMLEAVASFTAIAVENARIMISLNEMNQVISGEKERVEKAALASSWLAEHDSLTGLFNRRFLERILDESIDLARFNNSSIALFFIDLDDFKEVNDTYGHEAGDRVLVTVGARLLSVFREGDYVARVGGDEFIVVAPGLKDACNIAYIADKLIGSFCESLEVPGGPIRIGATVGVALFPDHGRSSKEIISRADEAMYSVKRTSKGAWRLWSRTWQA
jgi:diguanylate cyclase (GGDEF)-like protein